jgi:uncharacterized membrane protein
MSNVTRGRGFHAAMIAGTFAAGAVVAEREDARSSAAKEGPEATAYAFTTFDFPGATLTRVLGINNRGDMVGVYNIPVQRGSVPPGKAHGFLIAKEGSVSTIDFPGSPSSQTVAVNDEGEIVGEYRDAARVLHGFLLIDGRFSTIDFPGALEVEVTPTGDPGGTRALGNNNAGEIVGRYLDAAYKFHGYLLAEGNFRTIDFPGATFTEIIGINDRRELVGRYRDTVGRSHGFVLAKGRFSTIDVPGAFFTEAGGINNDGAIVGDYVDAGGRHGFLFFRGAFSTIDPPGAVPYVSEGVIAERINDRGKIVGDCPDASGHVHGFAARSEDTEGSSDGEP